VDLLPHPKVGPWPNDRPAIVQWILDDGSELSASVDSARGGTDQPFEEHELLAKFQRLLAPALPAAGLELERLIKGDADGRESWSTFVSRLTTRG
jgi:hypothetical protein